MNDVIDFINYVLSPVSAVFGILTTVPIFWTWYSIVWGKKKKHRRWHKEASSVIGALSSVLVVDMLPGKDVMVQVKHFMNNDEELKKIPEDRIFRLFRGEWLNLKDMPDFHKQLVDIIGEIGKSGTDVLHVFLASPVSAAAMIGAEFGNAGCQVLIYQNHNGHYENFGPLKFRVQ